MDNNELTKNTNNFFIYTSENKNLINKKIINIELNKNILDINDVLEIHYEVFGENNFYKQGIVKTKDCLVTSFTYNDVKNRYFVKINFNNKSYFHFFTPIDLDKQNIIMEIKKKNDTIFENIFENSNNLSLRYNNYDISKYHSEDENNTKKKNGGQVEQYNEEEDDGEQDDEEEDDGEEDDEEDEDDGEEDDEEEDDGEEDNNRFWTGVENNSFCNNTTKKEKQSF